MVDRVDFQADIFLARQYDLDWITSNRNGADIFHKVYPFVILMCYFYEDFDPCSQSFCKTLPKSHFSALRW